MFEPLDPKDNPLSNSDAQRKLQDYAKALEQEWADANSSSPEKTLSDEEVRATTKKLLVGGVPKAVARLLYLVEHAKSETVQQRSAMFIIEKALGKEAVGLVGDPFEALLKEMHGAASDE